MKITDLAVVFVILLIPLLWLSDQHSQDLLEAQRLSLKYTHGLQTAVQDGAFVLNENELQEYEAGYTSEKYFRADKSKALNAMLHTLYLNFGIQDDPAAQRVLMNYIPAIVIMDYDGYYIYSLSEQPNTREQNTMAYAWSAKKAYAYADADGNVIHFTLDHYASVYDAAGSLTRGTIDQLKIKTSVPIFSDIERYNSKKQTVIVQLIEQDLAAVMNRHNISKGDMNYIFTIPSISGEEWSNSLQDIGILAFIQGIPVGDQFYNNYAFGGSRVLKKSAVYGGISSAGIKYFFKTSCNSEYKLEQVFATEREAAESGYHEAKTCRK